MKKRPRICRHQPMLYLVALTMIMLVLGNSKSPVVYADTATSEIKFGEDTILSSNDKNDESSNELEDMEEEAEFETEINNNAETEEVLEENFEESKDKVELKDELVLGNTEEVGIEMDEAQISLSSNEVVVKSYTELRNLIMSRGGDNKVDTYYLGSDITMEFSGIKVPEGYSFTIDGMDPETKETHKITQYNNSYFERNIYYDYSQSSNDVTFILRNLSIQGSSNYGLLRTRGSNVTQVYENIVFTGSQFAYADTGAVLLNNVNLWVRYQGYEPMFAATGDKIILLGSNSIKSETVENGVFSARSELIFERGSNTEIITNKSIISNYNNVTVIIKEDSNVKYKSDGVVGVNDSNIPITVISAKNLQLNGTLDINAREIIDAVISVQTSLYNSGTMNINIDKSRKTIISNPQYIREGFVIDGGTVNITSKMTQYILTLGNADIRNGSTVNINVDKVNQVGSKPPILALTNFRVQDSAFNIKVIQTSSNNSTSLFGANAVDTKYEFLDSKVNIDTGTRNHNSIFTARALVVDTSTSDDSYFIIKTASPNTKLLSDSSGSVNIKSQQVNVWTDEPNLNSYPDNDKNLKRHGFKDNRLVTLDYSYSTYSGLKYNKDTTVGMDYGDFKTFKNNGFRILAIGGVPLRNNENSTDGSKIQFDTNPSSWVKFGQSPYVYTYADNSGNVNYDYEYMIPNGSYPVSVYSGYLFREGQLIYSAEKPLEIISVPTSLDFGSIQLKDEPSLYNRTDDMRIIIGDGRYYKTGWKLSVYVESPLQISNKPNSTLNNALVFNDSHKTLSSKPMTVYETDGYSYDDEIEIVWTKEEGIRLFIESYANVTINEMYESKLVWVLEEK